MNGSQCSSINDKTSKVISLDIYKANKAKVEEVKRKEEIEKIRLDAILIKQVEKRKIDERVLNFMANCGHVIFVIIIALVMLRMFSI